MYLLRAYTSQGNCCLEQCLRNDRSLSLPLWATLFPGLKKMIIDLHCEPGLSILCSLADRSHLPGRHGIYKDVAWLEGLDQWRKWDIQMMLHG